MDDRKCSTSPASRCTGPGSESEPIADDARPSSGRKVDAYCFHGDELSRGVAAALRIMGVETHSPQDGVACGTEQGLPTNRNTAATNPH